MDNPFIGKKVIIQTPNNELWMGRLTRQDTTHVTLADAWHIYACCPMEGVGFAAMAVYGINPFKSIINPPCEIAKVPFQSILLCTDRCTHSVESYVFEKHLTEDFKL